MAGYDLEIDGPRFVPLDVALAEPKLLDKALYETAEVFFG